MFGAMASTLADLVGTDDPEDDEDGGYDPFDVVALLALTAFVACAGLAGFWMSVGFAALASALLILALLLGSR